MKKLLKQKIGQPVTKKMKDDFIAERKKLFRCPRCEKRFKLVLFSATLAVLFTILGPKYRNQHNSLTNSNEFIAFELEMATELDQDLLDAAITDIDLSIDSEDTSIN